MPSNDNDPSPLVAVRLSRQDWLVIATLLHDAVSRLNTMEARIPATRLAMSIIDQAKNG